MATINIIGLVLLCLGCVMIFCAFLIWGGPLMALLGLLGMLVGAIMFLESPPNPIYEYPASDYTLSYKITIEGEQVDTTYVLTKIE